MTTVREIMREKSTFVAHSASIQEVALKMKGTDISIIPVCENGKLRGIITQENMINRIIAGSIKNRHWSAVSLMSSDVPNISPRTSIIDKNLFNRQGR